MRQFTNTTVSLFCILMLLVISMDAKAANQTNYDPNAKIYNTVADYIFDYKDMAISEMHRVKVPASITLAQAILESQYGNSYLANEGNNHFGIKCHKSWNGRKVYRDDDEENECFRAYPSDYSSFQDHSEFLLRSRYAGLFKLSLNDYKGWCRGLKKAGYATDPTYDEQLINVIEKYDLYQFDIKADQQLMANAGSSNTSYSTKENKPNKSVLPSLNVSKSNKTKSISTSSNVKESKTKSKTAKTFVPAKSYAPDQMKKGEIFYYNHIKTVVTTESATPIQIAMLYGINLKKLLKYNYFIDGQVVPENTKVYLQSRRNKGPFNIPSHKVKIGESMQEIAHHYGVKEDKLYKRNNMEFGMQPAPGEVIQLRDDSGRRPVLMTEIYQDEKYANVNKKRTQPVSQEQPVVVDQSSVKKESYIPEEFKKGNTNINQSVKPVIKTDAAAKSTTVQKNASVPVPNKPKTNAVKTYNYAAEKKVTEKQTFFDQSEVVTNNNVQRPVNTKKVVSTSEPLGTTFFDNSNSTITTRVIEKKTVEPKKTYTTTNLTESAKPMSNIDSSSKTIFHVVKKGDTLYNISRKYGIAVADLKRLNSLATNVIKLDQRLTIQTR